MKRISIIYYYGVLAILALPVLPLQAEEDGVTEKYTSGATAKQVEITRVRDSVTVSMSLVLDSMEVRSNRSVVLQPLLSGQADKAWLPAVEVMGRRRHIYYERNGHRTYAKGIVQVVRKKDGPQTVDYRATLPYEPWMDHARLDMTEDLCGCGQVQSSSADRPLAQADIAFVPRLAYITPQAVTRKMRELKGSAYLDFPVNKTDIYPDYRRNPQELGKIRATIDTVRHDPDARITAFSIKGFASPEGTYALNTRLAQGRTEALKRYLTDRYGFADTLFVTSFEPENWEGLRECVLQTGLQDKDEIIALIDSDLQPDAKEARLKREHPQSYRILLTEYYPGLRRSDYVVTYQIRGFNAEEAKERILTEPQKLSLQEMFAVSQLYEPGTEEFNQVFDVAVRMFPSDPVANLNAANALLESGHVAEALPYLDKAGDSPQAANARAVALLLQQKYDEALPLLQQAGEAGLAEAKENKKLLNEE